MGRLAKEIASNGSRTEHGERGETAPLAHADDRTIHPVGPPPPAYVSAYPVMSLYVYAP